MGYYHHKWALIDDSEAPGIFSYEVAAEKRLDLHILFNFLLPSWKFWVFVNATIITFLISSLFFPHLLFLVFFFSPVLLIWIYYWRTKPIEAPRMYDDFQK